MKIIRNLNRQAAGNIDEETGTLQVAGKKRKFRKAKWNALKRIRDFFRPKKKKKSSWAEGMSPVSDFEADLRRQQITGVSTRSSTKKEQQHEEDQDETSSESSLGSSSFASFLEVPTENPITSPGQAPDKSTRKKPARKLGRRVSIPRVGVPPSTQTQAEPSTSGIQPKRTAPPPPPPKNR